MPRSGILAIVAALVLAAGSAEAACGDVPADAGELAAARDAVAAACPCDAPGTHSQYVRCSLGVTRARVTQGLLRPACKTAVQRCASRSTCGRPGAITCCRTSPNGKTGCAVRSSAARCVAPRGGSACVGAYTSCCDACGTGGCTAPTTTTTSTLPPCGGGPFSCGGSCPAGLTCSPLGDFPPYCGCAPDGSQPCGDATYPFCNGQCTAGTHCGASGLFPDAPCICVPDGSTACGGASAPTCAGACTGTDVCQAVRVSGLTLCSCVSSTATCGCNVGGPCPGQVCEVFGACGCTAP